MLEPTVIEGRLVAAAPVRIAVLCTRFNSFIVEHLERGCLDTLARHGVDDGVTVVRVPGAFELPVVAAKVARSGKYDAVIALGAVIRGATAHFEHVAGACSHGLAGVAAETGLPVVFGVLTTDTIEQAVERAGTKAGNKGADAAVTALEMISLLRQL
jgi:6,7-dimethyl-8-ribityllumazine synthase